MRGLLTCALGAAAIAFSPVANAQTYSWTGFYVGAQAGYGWTGVDGSATIGGATATGDDSESGVNGGLFGGYGMQFGKFFVGAEIGASLSGAEYEESASGITTRLEQKETLEAAVRAGVLLHPQTMLYGRIGIVRTNFEASASDGTTSASGDDDFNGLRFGVGVEHALTSNIRVRGEYTYTNYEDKTYRAGADSVTLDADESLVRVGVAYGF